jgi:plasmid stabilization system protein ParE
VPAPAPEWRKAARADLQAIIDYISDANEDAAQRLKDEIETKVSGLPDHPRRYRPGRVAATREMLVRPNYVVVYSEGSKGVVVLRILHAARQWPPARKNHSSVGRISVAHSAIFTIRILRRLGFIKDGGMRFAFPPYARYDPYFGRWLSRDPSGEGGGLNLYGYVAGDPVNATDPFGLCQCQGNARVLGGNPALIGQPGGYSTPNNPIPVTAGSAAVIPSQWPGGTSYLRNNGANISGTTANGTPLFKGVTDVMGGTSPISGENVRTAMQQLNPGDLLIELPSGSDMGVIPVTINTPDGEGCPAGTSPVK